MHFKSPLGGLTEFLVIENSLKVIKNVYILKALFVFEVINFCPDWIRELRLISKLTLLTEQEIITIHILTKISRSKDKQSLELDQLIEYNKKNICIQK